VPALAAAGAFALLVREGRAEAEPQRVAIQVPARADALLDEALVRVRGELFAMGLTAEVRSGEANAPAGSLLAQDVGGTLIVERDGAWIRIRAFGPASTAPAVQELDTRRADVSAEVVAVRAVEALRAVMTGLPERPPKEAIAAPKAPPTPPEVAPVSPPSHDALSVAPRDASALSVWLGPSALYDTSPRRAALGAELAVLWGRSAWFGGAQIGTSLLRAKLDDAVGQVYLRRSTALARLGFTFELSQSSELWLLLGGGLVRHSVQGKAAPGYVSESDHHDSVLLAGGIGGTTWFSPRFGAYLRLETSFATDATAVRVTAREIAVLERPALLAALGLTVRAPRALTP
jgi:hypothetical protein